MKFQVRDGFVVKIITRVDLGEGQAPQLQENNYFGGQVVDLKAEDATDHAHKLEPKDKDATAFLASLIVTPPPTVGVDIAALVAQQVATQIAAFMAAQAKATATTSTAG